MNDSTTALDEPVTDAALTRPFTGASPYDTYVRASVLNSLQQPLTEAPDEMGFLVTTQVMELWFTLIVHEWRTARVAFAKDDLHAATDALTRSRRALTALGGAWAP
ncbi:tryptophan 2,3-dioxygenase family protein, partial [Streptomyces rochei]